jgi:hypothetical protein
LSARATPGAASGAAHPAARQPTAQGSTVLRIALALVAGIWLSGCTALIVTGAVVGTAAATAGAVVSTGVGAVAGAVKGVASAFGDDEE